MATRPEHLNTGSVARAVVETLESRRLLAGQVEIGTRGLWFTDPAGGDGTIGQRIAIRNGGDTTLTIPTGGITLVQDSAQFVVSTPATAPIDIAPGTSRGIYIYFDPSSSADVGSIHTAILRVRSNDPDDPIWRGSGMRGLVTAGFDGANEPSLQKILDLYQIGLDVGDDDPSTSVLNDPVPLRDSEIIGQRFVQAGNGPVTIETLATFGVGSRPAVKLGYYEPGTPAVSKELLDVPNAQAQTVDVRPQGSTAFDPQGKAFGFYGIFPGFKNPDGLARTVYSEDWLNTWEPVNRFKHKVRFYELRTGSGRLVPNAYVMAFEEFTGNAPDNQDFVAIVRNVRSIPSGPELGLEVPTGSPFPNRMVFNKIRTKDATIPNRTLETGTLRIHNVGDRTLELNDLVVSGSWEIVGTPPTSILARSSADVQLRFTATGGSLHLASIQIYSNDADEPRKIIDLAGYWQRQSENQQEPELERLMRLYGYGTVVRYGGEDLNQGGASGVTAGDEVLSPYWVEADPSMPVVVRQLNAFHTQGDKARLNWHEKGSETATEIVQHAQADGQTFFPRLDGSQQPAMGTFNPSLGTVFGFRVDANEWSDDTKNEFGHQMRFYPVRDREGSFVPNTFLMVMDYDGINYDYNDNVYLISNIRPETRPSSPVGFNAVVQSNGVSLDWSDSPESDAEYRVYRSTQAMSGFTEIGGVLTASKFLDTAVTRGTTYYYRVRTLANGEASLDASTNIRFV